MPFGLRKFVALLPLMAAFSAPAAPVDFNRDIRPIFSDTCFKCHGPDTKAVKGGLRLDRRGEVLKHQDKLLVPGQPERSELLRRLTTTDADDHMPPPESGLQLAPEQIAKVRQWIAEGAKWPEDDRHWAFIPPQRPPLPSVTDSHWSRNAVDRFVLARLEREGLAPAGKADRRTLLRRVTFDLTGLPPTPAEQAAFLNDRSPDAFERVVDRLLASPRYGEHLALPWLEASRYADTDGYQNDRLRYQWAWRDWVLLALNGNVPFDRFTLEQMAGDLLPDANFTTQVATGFNRNHRINSEGGSIPDEWIVEYVADRVETMGTVYLGLTFNCARCHDHKYDPIAQKEFYRLFAFFNNIAEAGLGPNDGNSPPFIPVPKSWPLLASADNRFVVPDPVRIKVVQTSVPRPQSGPPNTVMVMHELDRPRDTFVLERGLYDRPDKSERLTPQTPQVLGHLPERTPANRVGLAQWLLDEKNPLVARVTVNRHWQHFFGLGLVKTSENFGVQGEPPSHPELLDWLATEFLRTGWDVKALHRLMVLSATYRQDSRITRQSQQSDPENRLLAHGPRKRLTPYQIRDAALFNAGLLVEKLGGPSVKPYLPPGLWKAISNRNYDQGKGADLYRRSLYTYWMRTIPPPTMMAFNASEREVCTVRKDHTTTPLQALTLMNNITFVEAARRIAERILDSEPSRDPVARLDLAFRMILGREPAARERQTLLRDHDDYLREFSGDAKRALGLLSIGDSPRDVAFPAAEVAAWTLVANTLMNLDEAITTN